MLSLNTDPEQIADPGIPVADGRVVHLILRMWRRYESVYDFVGKLLLFDAAFLQF